MIKFYTCVFLAAILFFVVAGLLGVFNRNIDNKEFNYKRFEEKLELK